MTSVGTLFASEHDPRLVQLEHRLRGFYASCQSYDAFKTVNSKPEFWAPIRANIAQMAARGHWRVLEVGTGRTGFAVYLGEELRGRVFFAVQDVVDRNAEHFFAVADRVYTREITRISERYDVIFRPLSSNISRAPKPCLDI